MKLARLVLFGALALGAVGPGCGGGDGLPREAISGTITLGGTPLESGVITFMPTDPAAAQSAGEARIQAGSYRIPADAGLVPGPYRVSISSPVPVGQPANRGGRAFEDISGTGAEDADQEVPLRESVPARYNASSTLTAEVTADGTNEFNYDLEPE